MSIATEIQRLQTAKANIKSAIENKGVTVGDGTIDTYAEKIGEISGGDYNQGYEDGKKSVVDYLPLAKTVQFSSLNVFGKAEVVLNLDNAITLADLIRTASGATPNNTVEHLTINATELVQSMINLVYQPASVKDTVLKKLTLNVNTKNATNFSGMIHYCTALEEIDGTPLDLSSATNTTNIFAGCSNLIEVRFVTNSIKRSIPFNSCNMLSTETIQSIIDGLADLSSGTAQTLTLHATVGAKLTDTQKATITAKNWTLVY